MMKKSLLIVLALLCSFTSIFAQDNTSNPESKWNRGIGLGLDFAQLLQINPKQGAGEDRIGIGGAISVYANYKNGRAAWANSGSLNFAVQRLGSGLSVINPNIPTPFQKTVDILRFDSKYGYKTAEDSKFFYAADLTFISQLTNTYAGNFMRDITDTNQNAISKLFSPATTLFSFGIDYKPNDTWTFFYSPISMKMIIVADDFIASTEARNADGIGLGKSVFGNPWRSTTDFDNVDFQVGSLLKVGYQNKFLKDSDGKERILFKSLLSLYSNYLREPQNIDVDWLTETNFVIFKGLGVVLTTNLFYDHDVFVQITDRNAVGGVRGLGRRISFTEQLLIKYTLNF